MKINNPEVTLVDDARKGVKEDIRSGFLDWLYQFSVTGDDGEFYSIGGSILSLAVEKLDLVTMNIAKGFGSEKQLSNSIYKVANYPGMLFERMIHYPQGRLEIINKAHSILIQCGKEYSVECFEDHSWHFHIDSMDGVYKADLYHRPHGFPLWYGRETPSYLTQHSITYGYNWAGDVEGSFWYKGKQVKVKGTGIRERYVSVDSSAAELGGWEDWGFVTFNEMHSSMYDMRLGKKDFSLYDLENKKHYPEGDMIITHSDWVFLRPLDGFIPTHYNIRISVEDGIYEINAHVGNATTWGVTFQVPDNPVATLSFDKTEGTFTFNNGGKRILTEGRGGLSVRQWHAYPNILPRQLYSDEVMKGEKFETL